MSVHEMQPKIIKRQNIEAVPSRSECTLLWELIQRNPDRTKAFLERLGYVVKNPVDKTQHVVSNFR